MAIHASSRTPVRFAATIFAAVLAFSAVVHAAEPEPDPVSLSEQTVSWSTVKFSTSADNGLVDGERTRSIRSFDAGLIAKLVDTFARTTPPLLDELRSAAERGEDTTVRQLAHKLRGSSDTVGAQRLAELARQLELGEGADSTVAELQRVYEGTMEELQRL